MSVMTWVYRILLLGISAGVVSCIWTEKKAAKQVSNAIVLIPLILRFLMIK